MTQQNSAGAVRLLRNFNKAFEIQKYGVIAILVDQFDFSTREAYDFVFDWEFKRFIDDYARHVKETSGHQMRREMWMTHCGAAFDEHWEFVKDDLTPEEVSAALHEIFPEVKP